MIWGNAEFCAFMDLPCFAFSVSCWLLWTKEMTQEPFGNLHHQWSLFRIELSITVYITSLLSDITNLPVYLHASHFALIIFSPVAMGHCFIHYLKSSLHFFKHHFYRHRRSHRGRHCPAMFMSHLAHGDVLIVPCHVINKHDRIIPVISTIVLLHLYWGKEVSTIYDR